MRRQDPAHSIDNVIQEGNRLINHFFHDFKGGLSTVITCIEAIRDGIGGPVLPGQVPWLEKAERKCAHMVALINDFRDMTQIEDGGFPPEAEVVDLAECYRSLQAALGPEAAQRRVWARFEAAGPLPSARFEYPLVARLLERLHGVMLDCTRPGGELASRLGIGERPGGRDLELEIRAEGVECGPDALETVFDKLSQAEMGLQLGRGYTMLFCRTAARCLGGDLRLAPWPGRGNRAELRLPLA